MDATVVGTPPFSPARRPPFSPRGQYPTREGENRRNPAPAYGSNPTMRLPATPFLAALLTASLMSCGEPAGDAEESRATPAPPSSEILAAVRAPAGFRGTLPCADCPGIRTTLELAADGSATLTRLYLEAEAGRDTTMIDEARWTDGDAGHLVVAPEGQDELYFGFDRDGLLALDREGQPYDSSLPRRLERLPRGEAAELTGTAWAVIDPAGADEAPGALTAALRFGTQGRLAGADGCDELTGAWSVRAGTLSITAAATSMRTCTDEVVRRAEQIDRALEAATTYRIEASQLVLLDANGAEVARFRPIA